MSNDGFLDRARILLWGPFARFLYRRRYRERYNRRFPMQWLTAREILFLDLDNYTNADSNFALDKNMLSTLVDARDKLAERSRRLVFIGYACVLVVVSRYLGLDLNIPIEGIELGKFVFIRETLLLFATFLSTASVVFQSNIHTLENTISFIITKSVPAALQQVYASMYLPHTVFTRYIPKNIPHIYTVKMNLTLTILPIKVFLYALIIAVAIYYTLIVFMVVDIWQNPEVPFWSKAAAVLIAVGAINGAIYSFSTRFKMQYQNHITMERINYLIKNDPSQFEIEFGEEYNVEVADRTMMIKRGYFGEDYYYSMPI